MVTVQDLSQTYYGQKQAHKFSQVISDGIAETPDTTDVTVEELNVIIERLN